MAAFVAAEAPGCTQYPLCGNGDACPGSSNWLELAWLQRLRLLPGTRSSFATSQLSPSRVALETKHFEFH